jgi:hypothetical protein
MRSGVRLRLFTAALTFALAAAWFALLCGPSPAQPAGRTVPPRAVPPKAGPYGFTPARYEWGGEVRTAKSPITFFPFNGTDVQHVLPPDPNPDGAQVRELTAKLVDPVSIPSSTKRLVRQRLDERGFQEFRLCDWETTDLSPASPAAASPGGKAGEQAGDRPAGLWSVSWGLELPGRDKPIALPRSCRVNTLVRNGNLQIDLSGLPAPGELPEASELQDNVREAAARGVARDHFLKNSITKEYRLPTEDLKFSGTKDYQLRAEDLEFSPPPRLELWRAEPEPGKPWPDGGRYRLAWALTIGVRGEVPVPVAARQYRVEAKAADPRRPAILSTWPLVLHAVGAHRASGAPAQDPPRGEQLIPTVGEEEARQIARNDFIERETTAGYRFDPDKVEVIGPQLGLAKVDEGQQVLAWHVIVLAPSDRAEDGPALEYWVEARHDDRDVPDLHHKPVNRKLLWLHGRVLGMTWFENRTQADPRSWVARPLNRLSLDLFNQFPPCVTRKGGEFFGLAPQGFRVPFRLTGAICQIDRLSGHVPQSGFAAVVAGRGAMDIVLDPNRWTDLTLLCLAQRIGDDCRSGGNLDCGASRVMLLCSAAFLLRPLEVAALVNTYYWANVGFDYYVSHLRTEPRLPHPPIRLIVNHPNLERYSPNAPGLAPRIYMARDMSRVNPLYQQLNGACPDLVLHEFGHAMTWISKAGLGDDPRTAVQEKAYAEGFADAFSVLIRRMRIVGADLMIGGGHVRDYRYPKTRVIIDGKRSDVSLTLSSPKDEKLKTAFSDQFGDDEPHLTGRVYVHFICDLIDRLATRWGAGIDIATPSLGACDLGGRISLRQSLLDRVYDRVASLVIAADRGPRRNIPEAVYFIYENAYPDEQSEIAAAARDRQIDQSLSTVQGNGRHLPAEEGLQAGGGG